MAISNKKGVELTLNTIIIMTLVIIILLVLIFMVTGGFQNFNKGTGCEEGKHGRCTDKCLDTEVLSAWKCDGTKICCSINPLGG